MAPAARPAIAESAKLPAAELSDDGVYTQPWFLDSFLDLRDDITESAAAGKQLVILWEQRGCPYCKETHMVNLRIPEIVDYIKAHFNVVQLNLWGDREVTDVDGEVTTEKKLARKYRVQFTPTLQFFPPTLAADNTMPGHDVEVWRLLGYWKPFHFMNSFVYVHSGGYQTEPNFQRWLQVRADELRAQGKEVELW
ncbi:MAG: thioredoxin fold domain-containing protein [Rhodospirillales bacterium]|nr:thioredoxin fold domain-containing protein [Rhodospirillales bacterium]